MTNLQRNTIELRVWPFGCGKGRYGFVNALVVEWEVCGSFEPLEAQYCASSALLTLPVELQGAELLSRPSCTRLVPDSISMHLPSPFQRCFGSLFTCTYTATGSNGKYKCYWYIQRRYLPQLYTRRVVESLRGVSVIYDSICEADTRQRQLKIEK